MQEAEKKYLMVVRKNVEVSDLSDASDSSDASDRSDKFGGGGLEGE